MTEVSSQPGGSRGVSRATECNTTAHGSSPRSGVFTLPCLSILQPWAGLTLRGPKRIENRTWGTRTRGTMLIHAGLSERLLGGEARREIVADLERRGLKGASQYFDCGAGKMGAIVGVAYLSYCTRSRMEAIRQADEMHDGLGFSQEIFADQQLPRNCYWVWGAVAAFEKPVKYRGAQAIFNVPVDAVREEMGKLNWRVG